MAEENNEKSEGKFISKVRENPYVLTSWILGILCIILILMLFLGNGGTTGEVIGVDSAGENTEDFLEEIFGADVDYQSGKEENEIYHLDFMFEGQLMTLQTTKDFSFLRLPDGMWLKISEFEDHDFEDQYEDAQPREEVQKIEIFDSKIEHYSYLGNKNAPVTIVEFSDYSCPFCTRHYEETKPLIEDNYIKEGLVRYIFADFVGVGTSRPHEAALCVREMGGEESFWKMNGMILVENEDLEVLASEVGIDSEEFKECLDSGKFKEEVAESTNFGQSLGVGGTPGFLIGNEEEGYELVSGAQPYNIFEEKIEEILK